MGDVDKISKNDNMMAESNNSRRRHHVQSNRAHPLGISRLLFKESQKMPGVKSLHQNSENSGKPEYIRGHHFGFVGLLVGSLAKAFCLPLQGQLHEGIEEIRPGKPFAGKPATLITRMAHLVVKKAKQTGCLCYVTLDAYFSVGPIFQICKDAVNEQEQRWVHVITRAKDNYVVYMYDEAPQKKFDKKKGRSMESLWLHRYI